MKKLRLGQVMEVALGHWAVKGRTGFDPRFVNWQKAILF